MMCVLYIFIYLHLLPQHLYMSGFIYCNIKGFVWKLTFYEINYKAMRLMKQIINSSGEVEYLISHEEKTIFEIALRNLAISTPSLAFERGVEHD